MKRILLSCWRRPPRPPSRSRTRSRPVELPEQTAQPAVAAPSVRPRSLSPPRPRPPRSARSRATGAACSTRSATRIGAAPRPAIATLPDSPLKAVARAELFTAKNSPRTELGPILALLAEAPDLPHADQLQRLAMARGAVEPPAIFYPRPTIGLPPRRAAAAPARSAASPPPTRCGSRSSPWSRSTTRPAPKRCCSSRRPISPTRRAPKPRSASPSSITSSAATPTPAASPTSGGPARPANGARRRRGSAGSRRGGWATSPLPSAPSRDAMRLGRGRRIRRLRGLLGGARGAGRPPPARGPAVAAGRGALGGKLLRSARARNAGHDDHPPRPAHSLIRAASRRALPNVRRASELVAIGERSAGRADAPPPGQDRLARRPAGPHRCGALARPWRGAILARAQRPAGHAGRRRRPLSRRRAGPPTMAGGSIRRWPTPTSSRKAISAPKRSARPTPSG